MPYQAYNQFARMLKKQLQEKKYDLIIDLHRDDPKKDRTTIVVQ